MVLENSNIKKRLKLKTKEELKQNTGKPRWGMDGKKWTGLKWVPSG